MIRATSIYDGNAPQGMRVLVTRWWPRGFHKGSFDSWVRDLAPSAVLLKRYRAGLPWGEFEAAYRAEMGGPAAGRALAEMRQLAAETDITLLCYEPDGQNCHRNILLEMLGG